MRAAGDFILYIFFMISPDLMTVASLTKVILRIVSQDSFLIVVV